MDPSDSESSDGESWRSTLFEQRIDFHWLPYNPHTFLPLDEHFYLTGSIPRISLAQNPAPPDWHPNFLIGCGRSGSTILAKILSSHPSLCFLNEPRSLWLQVFPTFDVWSVQAATRAGHLRMPKSTDPQSASEITSLFYSVAETLDKPCLVEKTPENTFRLDWLDSLFPSCKFVMVKRNPIQTVRSISRFQPVTWFGFEEYKWKQLLVVLQHFKVLGR
jgi:hypothetical protein